MSKCKTCELIEFMKTSKSEVCDTKLFAKISEYRWFKGQKKIKSKRKGEYTSKAFNLNYCPTCGKKLESESKEVIRDAGYHQRICLEILSKYKEIIGGE